MSNYKRKKRRSSRNSNLRNGYKMASYTRAYTTRKSRTLSHFPTTAKITLSDNGSTICITRGMVAHGKKIGYITNKGRMYNVVIVPNPNPDTNIDDDIIIKPKKQQEGEA